MINSIYVGSQTVVANTGNVLFTSDRVRTPSCMGCNSYLYHENGSSQFTLTQGGVYKISYNANVTSATVGAATLAIKANGEAIIGSDSTYTVATADAVGNVSANIRVKVPCNTSLTISLGNISANDLIVTDPNIVIERA